MPLTGTACGVPAPSGPQKRRAVRFSFHRVERDASVPSNKYRV